MKNSRGECGTTREVNVNNSRGECEQLERGECEQLER